MADTSAPRTSTRVRSLPRIFVLGFAIGFVVTVPAAMLALIFSWAESALPWVVPGLLLTRPLSSVMQDWPGAVNLGLAALANGLVYGLVVLAVVTVVRRTRSSSLRPH
jgi:uncharacterized membrane protein